MSTYLTIFNFNFPIYSFSIQSSSFKGKEKEKAGLARCFVCFVCLLLYSLHPFLTRSHHPSITLRSEFLLFDLLFIDLFIYQLCSVLFCSHPLP